MAPTSNLACRQWVVTERLAASGPLLHCCSVSAAFWWKRWFSKEDKRGGGHREEAYKRTKARIAHHLLLCEAPQVKHTQAQYNTRTTCALSEHGTKRVGVCIATETNWKQVEFREADPRLAPKGISYLSLSPPLVRGGSLLFKDVHTRFLLKGL